MALVQLRALPPRDIMRATFNQRIYYVQRDWLQPHSRHGLVSDIFLLAARWDEGFIRGRFQVSTGFPIVKAKNPHSKLTSQTCLLQHAQHVDHSQQVNALSCDDIHVYPNSGLPDSSDVELRLDATNGRSRSVPAPLLPRRLSVYTTNAGATAMETPADVFLRMRSDFLLKGTEILVPYIQPSSDTFEGFCETSILERSGSRSFYFPFVPFACLRFGLPFFSSTIDIISNIPFSISGTTVASIVCFDILIIHSFLHFVLQGRWLPNPISSYHTAQANSTGDLHTLGFI